jgi:hypothetical protein
MVTKLHQPVESSLQLCEVGSDCEVTKPGTVPSRHLRRHASIDSAGSCPSSEVTASSDCMYILVVVWVRLVIDQVRCPPAVS